MKQLELRADILRERNLKKLGVQGPGQHGSLKPTCSNHANFGSFQSMPDASDDSGDTVPRRAASFTDAEDAKVPAQRHKRNSAPCVKGLADAAPVHSRCAPPSDQPGRSGSPKDSGKRRPTAQREEDS